VVVVRMATSPVVVVPKENEQAQGIRIQERK